MAIDLVATADVIVVLLYADDKSSQETYPCELRGYTYTILHPHGFEQKESEATWRLLEYYKL